jgi:hypothetical protein
LWWLEAAAEVTVDTVKAAVAVLVDFVQQLQQQVAVEV